MTPIDQIQWVSEGLAVWGDYNPGCKVECHSTFVDCGEGCIVIDPLPLSDQAWEELTRAASLRAVILTSENHERASREFAERAKVPVFAPEEARGEVSADEWFPPNALLVGNARSMALPGGALGECAIMVGNVLVFGDAIIHLGEDLELLPSKYCRDQRELVESLACLRGLNVQTLAFAHGWPVTQHASGRLLEFLASLEN